MSRPSAASLSIVPVVPLARLLCPIRLSEVEAALWTAVVDSKPADWFGAENAPLLTEYVRAAVLCDELDVRVKAAMAGGESGELKGLLTMRDTEAKRAMSLATKLRLTQQSRWQPSVASVASKKAGNARPWQQAQG